MRKNIISTIALAAAIFLAGSFLSAPGSTVLAAGPEGHPAPEFKLPDLDGKTVSLADFKNKVVLLTFWASW